MCCQEWIILEDTQLVALEDYNGEGTPCLVLEVFCWMTVREQENYLWFVLVSLIEIEAKIQITTFCPSKERAMLHLWALGRVLSWRSGSSGCSLQTVCGEGNWTSSGFLWLVSTCHLQPCSPPASRLSQGLSPSEGFRLYKIRSSQKSGAFL
jgi:hypothetical protein